MSAELLHTHGPGNVATLLTSTHENRIGTIADTVFSKRVLLDWLNRKAKITKDGGASIVGGLMTSKNASANSYDDGDTLTVAHEEGFTTYQYPWKQYAVSIEIFGREERVQNNGVNKIHDIVQMKLDRADKSLADDINTDLFATGGSKSTNDLVTFIDATSTIGGINSTTSSFWQSDLNVGGSFSAQGLADMRTLWYDLSKKEGAGDPDLLMTTSDIFGFYESQLVAQQRYTSTDTGNGSFQSLMFKTAPMMFDEQSTSGVIYYLNSEVIKWCISSTTNFVLGEWVKPVDEDTRAAQIFFAGEMITDNRRKLGKITGITA